MSTTPHYIRSKGKTRERSTSRHHTNQRIERACSRAYGRIQEVMYRFSDEVRELPDEESLVKFLDDYEVFSYGYRVKPHERLMYVGGIVAELRREKLILDGHLGGFHLASKAKEYQQGAVQRAAAAEQERRQQASKPNVDAPGFSWKAWNQELRVAS